MKKKPLRYTIDAPGLHIAWGGGKSFSLDWYPLPWMVIIGVFAMVIWLFW